MQSEILRGNGQEPEPAKTNTEPSGRRSGINYTQRQSRRGWGEHSCAVGHRDQTGRHAVPANFAAERCGHLFRPQRRLDRIRGFQGSDSSSRPIERPKLS